VVWQTGAKYVLPESAKSTLPSSVHLVTFIDDMPAVYAAADLVVCRAGALTLSELAAAGKPSIVVPSPNVTDDHQTHNARSLERAGTALVVADSVAADQLIPLALTLMSGDHRLQVMTGLAGALQATLRLSPPAAEQIAADASEQFKLESHG
jgi:UDP-N-acetylglucosamine--N-acetylmuramyl-(pentapeptide) pyrophosphoryl-undecaprenol N-acetylglucosamine transferase